MTFNRTTLPVAVLMALSACNAAGPSVSGSADESVSSHTGASSLWERVRGLGVDQSRTTDMPALGLIADAFLTDNAVTGAIPARIRISSMFEVNGSVMRLDQLVEHDLKFRTVPGPTNPGKSPLDGQHRGYAVPILVALAPLNGWEVEPQDDRRVDPAFDTPFFNRNRPPPRYRPEMHLRYMEMLSIAAIYTNAVFARIGKTLGDVRLADPDDARNRVITAYQAIPPAELRAMLADAARQIGTGNFNTDLTGSNNVHFVHSTSGDFVGDARGMTWTRAGGTWFGDGRLNGQTVSLKLFSTQTLAQRQAQTGTTSTQADAKVGGTSNVAPGR